MVSRKSGGGARKKMGVGDAIFTCVSKDAGMIGATAEFRSIEVCGVGARNGMAKMSICAGGEARRIERSQDRVGNNATAALRHA